MNKIIQHIVENLVIIFIVSISFVSYGQSLIIDHTCTNLNNISLNGLIKQRKFCILLTSILRMAASLLME